jgi:pyruvate kinase
MANAINAKAICTLTNSGYTAFQISAWRPSAYILVLHTKNLDTIKFIMGVKSYYYDKVVSTDDTVIDINDIVKKKGYVAKVISLSI